MLLRTCFALLVVAGAWAQQPRPATPPQKGDGPLTRSSFTAKGLQREDDLNDLFIGNFADVTFDRGSLIFSQLFQTYLEAYWRHCSAFLPPANRVEMTIQVCDEPPAPPTPFGQPPPPPHACTVFRTVSLGYADPALYAAKRELDANQGLNQLKDLAGFARSLRPALDVAQITSEMDALVRLNACGGTGLRRFQENVVLFSRGKQPLLLPGAPPPSPSAQPPGVLADSDYNRLVEDLVADQAKTWLVNRYVPGSTSQLIVAHDPTGRPSMIRAKYFFTSLEKSGRTQGTVRMSFNDGMPTCIYFFDAPSTCQTPDRRIVNRYLSGAYLDANAARPASSPAEPAPVQPSADHAALQAKAQAEASVRGSICVPDDLLAEWRNPPPGGKMEALQSQLKASLRERAKIPTYDQTKWMTVNSTGYSTWKPTGPFRGVVAATDGGSCAVGHREFLALNP
jgi:hypothetical protein